MVIGASPVVGRARDGCHAVLCVVVMSVGHGRSQAFRCILAHHCGKIATPLQWERNPMANLKPSCALCAALLLPAFFPGTAAAQELTPRLQAFRDIYKE